MRYFETDIRMNFLDDPSISRLLFYPRKTKIPARFPDNIEILQFHPESDIIIGGFFLSSAKSYPTLIIFHGNGEIAADYLHFLALYMNLPVNIAFIDYRGYGFSTGVPSFSNLVRDTMKIYDQMTTWLQSKSYSDRIIVLGRSLGSICASHIGKENPENLLGIIFESGFANLFDFGSRLFGQLPVSKEDLAPFSNDTKIRQIKKPTLVMHGKLDNLIPISEGKAIFNNLNDEVQKSIEIFENAGHNDIFNFAKEYNKALFNFITMILKK